MITWNSPSVKAGQIAWAGFLHVGHATDEQWWKEVLENEAPIENGSSSDSGMSSGVVTGKMAGASFTLANGADPLKLEVTGTVG